VNLSKEMLPAVSANEPDVKVGRQMITPSVTEILKILDPTGNEYQPADGFIMSGRIFGPKLQFDDIDLLIVPPIIGLEPPTFTISEGSFNIPEEKISQLVQLMGLPTNPQDYPQEYQDVSLKKTAIKFLRGFEDDSSLLSPINKQTVEIFKATAQSLDSFVLRVNGEVSKILLLFSDGKLTRRQTFQFDGGDLISDQLFDDQTRIANSFIKDKEDEVYFHDSLVDLPQPFYIEKEIYRFKDQDKYKVYYHVWHSGVQEKIGISPKLYDLLLEYIKRQKALMAQQFRNVIPSVKVPAIIDIIGGYL
jgi:hypothetical protein